MRIIKLKALKDFWEKHSDVEGALKSWYFEAKQASWESFDDIKKR